MESSNARCDQPNSPIILGDGKPYEIFKQEKSLHEHSKDHYTYLIRSSENLHPLRKDNKVKLEAMIRN